MEKIGTKDLLSSNPDKNYYQKSLPTYRKFFKNFTFVGESRFRNMEKGDGDKNESPQIKKNQLIFFKNKEINKWKEEGMKGEEKEGGREEGRKEGGREGDCFVFFN